MHQQYVDIWQLVYPVWHTILPADGEGKRDKIKLGNVGWLSK